MLNTMGSHWTHLPSSDNLFTYLNAGDKLFWTPEEDFSISTELGEISGISHSLQPAYGAAGISLDKRGTEPHHRLSRCQLHPGGRG